MRCWFSIFVIFWFICMLFVVLMIGIFFDVVSILLILCMLSISWFSFVGVMFGCVFLNLCSVFWSSMWYVIVVSGVFLDGFYIIELLYMNVSVVFYVYIVIGKLNVEIMLYMLIGCYVFIIWWFGCLDVIVRL